MTEDEWLAADANPNELLEEWSRRQNNGLEAYRRQERLRRLYGCACCRLIDAARLTTWGTSRLDLWERQADGEAVTSDDSPPPGGLSLYVSEAFRRVSEGAIGRVLWRVGQELDANDFAIFLPALRCIYGNPFRPLDGLVVLDERAADLARACHAAFPLADPDSFDVLGDALEESGLHDAAAHCRDRTAPHVRGCHVIDWALGLRR